MNGIHDMGGMHGFGPVVREENEPVFHEVWEGRMYAINGALRPVLPSGPGGVGGQRDVVEQLPATQYLTLSYHERRLHQLAERAIAGGLVGAQELEARVKQYQAHWAPPVPTRAHGEAPAVSVGRLFTPRRAADPTGEPHFKPGDHVLARNLNWVGHNRLPRYIRWKRGSVQRVNGWYEIEDAHQERFERSAQPIYTVGFDGSEVWGPECEPNLRIYLELWEGYLEPIVG